MDDSVYLIFMVGSVVFAITIGAAFTALIASDHPEDSEK